MACWMKWVQIPAVSFWQPSGSNSTLEGMSLSTSVRTRRGQLPSAFVGTAAESVLIDSDHWRHYFLLLGVIWGLMAVSRPYVRRHTGTVTGVGPATLAQANRAA